MSHQNRNTQILQRAIYSVYKQKCLRILVIPYKFNLWTKRNWTTNMRNWWNPRCDHRTNMHISQSGYRHSTNKDSWLIQVLSNHHEMSYLQCVLQVYPCIFPLFIIVNRLTLKAIIIYLRKRVSHSQYLVFKLCCNCSIVFNMIPCFYLRVILIFL
jgi:hypothetical protein